MLGFAVATGLAAHVQVLRTDSPVPHTMQTLVVVLAGMLLGARLGTLSMALYLALGVTGHLVFALNTPALGFAYLLGPTGGYLAGFLLAQPVIAWLSAPARTSPRTAMGPRLGWLAAAALAGNAIILSLGVGWLRVWTGGDGLAALAAGFWPFVPDALVKSALAASVALAAGTGMRRWLS